MKYPVPDPINVKEIDEQNRRERLVRELSPHLIDSPVEEIVRIAAVLEKYVIDGKIEE